jgi:dihydropteroate synthase
VSRIDVQSLWARQRAVVMGIVNVTPDSFADGGHHADTAGAVRHGLRLADEGADILDVGGESTRPGATPVDPDVEMARVVPVIAELVRRRPELLVSVDTAKPEVARAALEAGAAIVNDVTAGRADGMLAEVARAGAAVVLMHMRGTPDTMQGSTDYADVVAEVHEFLRGRAAVAERAGIVRERVWLDPGIGFGKDVAGNLRLLAALPDLAALGHPVVVGASRKSFIGTLTGAAVGDRLPGSLAALGSVVDLARVAVRTHDVAATVQFLAVATALERAS